VTENTPVYYIGQTAIRSCPNNPAHTVSGSFGSEDILAIERKGGYSGNAGLYNAVLADASGGDITINLPKIPAVGTDMIYWVGALGATLNNNDVFVTTSGSDTFQGGGETVSFAGLVAGPTAPQIYLKSDGTNDIWRPQQFGRHDQFSLDVQDKRGILGTLLQNDGDMLVNNNGILTVLPAGNTAQVLTIGTTGNNPGGLRWVNPNAVDLLQYQWAFEPGFTGTDPGTIPVGVFESDTNMAGDEPFPPDDPEWVDCGGSGGVQINTPGNFPSGIYRVTLSTQSVMTNGGARPLYQVLNHGMDTGGAGFTARVLFAQATVGGVNSKFVASRTEVQSIPNSAEQYFSLQFAKSGPGWIGASDVYLEIFRII
jgi:hypothetical protein